MPSPYRTQPNNTKNRTNKVSNTNFDNNPHRELDLKNPQVTSNDLAKPETNKKSKNRNKNDLKAGSMHENAEINDGYSDEILHKNDLLKYLAMQFLSIDKTVRSDTLQGFKEFNFQSLAT